MLYCKIFIRKDILIKIKQLRKINKIMKKSYKVSIACTVLATIALTFCVVSILNKKYAVTSEVVAEPAGMTRKTSMQNLNTENDIETLKSIIENNTKDKITEELYVEEIDLEFTTKYEQSSKIATGTMQVGIDGKQNITKKRTYKNEELVSDEAVRKSNCKSFCK